MSKIIKAISLIFSLSILSIAGSILINSAIAWTNPSTTPPTNNVSNLTLTALTLSGTGSDDLEFTQTTNARYYINSVEGLQMRIDSNNNDANSEFTINNGANQEIFKIDENGNITAKSDYLPTSDKHLTTKDYVDAAVAGAGTGDATLLNQELIMGVDFVSGDDSLAGLNSKLDTLSNNVGDATYEKQVEISSRLSLGTGWVLPSQTYYSVGGNTYFCRENSTDASGKVTITNINNSQQCDDTDGTWSCWNGNCVKLLTYSGATHTEENCQSAGGAIYDTGSGTICKISGTDISCPSGWSQADNWQSYSDGWGSYKTGDSCGKWTDVVPIIFSNSSPINYEKTTTLYHEHCWAACSDYRVRDNWAVEEDNSLGCYSGGLNAYLKTSSDPGSSNRMEIGCK